MQPSHNDEGHAEAGCEAQEREMARYPICAKCGERILDEFCYEEDGEYFCDDCFDKLHRVETPVFDEWED